MEINQKKKEKLEEENNKTISYSRNIFLPITNLCRNECSYCSFRAKSEEDSWIMNKKDVLEMVHKGKEADCTEAMITLGENPEVYETMKERLKEWGYDTTVDYLVDLSKEILKIGILPHTNPGIISRKELKRLKKWNASMGLMLECATELPAHEKSPGKSPEKRIGMIKNAGKLNIPFTTGILVGIGETWTDRIESLIEIKKIQEKYHHIQEMIIQPFVPKKGTPMENHDRPDASTMLNIVMFARGLMPEMNIQVPANLTDRLTDFLVIGANDLGGISTVTPDFINPEKPWPDPNELKQKLKSFGFELQERLPIYSNFLDEKYASREVLEVAEKLDKKLRKKSSPN